jgi:hypothetical protein
MEEASPDPGGVGLNVQKAIIGYVIHDSRVLGFVGWFVEVVDSCDKGGVIVWTRMM